MTKGYPWRGRQRRTPEQIDETVVDQLAEAVLRMLGVPARDAKRIAALDLPDIEGW